MCDFNFAFSSVSFEEASKYISFHALRSHGHLFNVGPVTEGVYIHAKVPPSDPSTFTDPRVTFSQHFLTTHIHTRHLHTSSS